MRKSIQHAWGSSDKALVIDLAEKDGWVLVEELTRSPASSNRKHWQLVFEKEVEE